MEIKKVNMEEIFSLLPDAEEHSLGLVKIVELEGVKNLKDGLPFRIKTPLLATESRNRGGLFHRLEFSSDNKLVLERRLVEIRQVEFLGMKLPFERMSFWPEVETEMKRLRLHIMKSGGRLEQTPDFEAIKKGKIKFSFCEPLTLEQLESVRLRFILAD